MLTHPAGRVVVLLCAAPFEAPPLLQAGGEKDKSKPKGKPLPDAIQDVQCWRAVKITRPEQKKNEHDKSDIFNEDNSPPSSPGAE